MSLAEVFECEFVGFLKIKQKVHCMKRHTTRISLNIPALLPCYGMQLPLQKLALHWPNPFQEAPLATEWLKIKRFLGLHCVGLVVKERRIDSSKCQQEYLISCFSTPILKRSEGTSKPFSVFQFSDNNTRNCYKWQLYILRLWDKTIRPFWETSDRGHTSTSGVKSYRWCCIARIAW